MHPSFLDVLCCPRSGSALRLKVTATAANGCVAEGALVANDGTRYPIVRGVPRFVETSSYAASFGVEWSRWARAQFEAENAGRPMAGHTTRMWEEVTGLYAPDLAGQTVVEFGCGPGRFLDVVRRRGGRAVGLELSSAADLARANFADDPDTLIVQGDVLQPPFRPGAFSAGYSIGVLHHTPDPPGGLAALVRAVRPGGWVACCVYPRGEFYDYRSVARVRALQLRLRPLVGYRFALAYAWASAHLIGPALFRARPVPRLRPLVERIAADWLPVLSLPDPTWAMLDIFDAITPEIASTHDQAELLSWFASAGCPDARPTPWCATSAVAVRPAGAPA